MHRVQISYYSTPSRSRKKWFGSGARCPWTTQAYSLITGQTCLLFDVNALFSYSSIAAGAESNFSTSNLIYLSANNDHSNLLRINMRPLSKWYCQLRKRKVVRVQMRSKRSATLPEASTARFISSTQWNVVVMDADSSLFIHFYNIIENLNSCIINMYSLTN